MTGKRKAFDDAPRWSQPPPQQRLRMEDGSEDASTPSENSGEFSSDGTYTAEDERSSSVAGNVGSSGDSDSNMTYVSGYSEGGDLAGDLGALNIQPANQVPAGSDSDLTYVSDYSEGSGLAGELGALNIQPQNQVPAEGEEPAAADGQHAEVEVQPPPPPPPADQHATAQVSDQSVAAAAPAPEMVVPAAESVECLGCGRELALVPRINPSGVPYCEYCDGPRH